MAPDQARELRERRRRIAREHHPDRGGDAAVYTALMAELDGRSGATAYTGGPGQPGADAVVTVRAGHRWDPVRRARRVSRSVSRSLRRRHYIDL